MKKNSNMYEKNSIKGYKFTRDACIKLNKKASASGYKVQLGLVPVPHSLPSLVFAKSHHYRQKLRIQLHYVNCCHQLFDKVRLKLPGKRQSHPRTLVFVKIQMHVHFLLNQQAKPTHSHKQESR